jgi:hypothetical protein
MGVNFEVEQREARERSVEAPELGERYRARSASCVTPVTNCPFLMPAPARRGTFSAVQTWSRLGPR